MIKTVPLAGVIGHPVAHSKSPRLHGGWLSDLGIPGHYIPMDVAPDDLAKVLKSLPKMGFRGVNITLPHKEAALGLAQEITDRAGRIGAANTLTFLPDGGLRADCTDGIGFLENLKTGCGGWTPVDGPVAVFGAGGAARAILDALIDGGAPEVRLTNRTRGRADSLAKTFGPKVRVIDWEDAATAADAAATLVNTTSLGMEGQPPFDIPLGSALPDAVATDIVYTPLDTAFLQAARAEGFRTVDGLGMLIHQAVPGFEAWFGATPSISQATRDRLLEP